MRFVDPTSACPALYVGCAGAFERSEPRSRMWSPEIDLNKGLRAARSSPVAFAAVPEQDSGAARVQAGIGHRGAAGRQRPTRDGA